MDAPPPLTPYRLPETHAEQDPDRDAGRFSGRRRAMIVAGTLLALLVGALMWSSRDSTDAAAQFTRQILWVEHSDSGSRLLTYDPDNSRREVVREGVSANAGRPVVLPGGEEMALAGDRGLVAVRLDTGERRTLTTAPLGGRDDMPVIGSGGSALLFVRHLTSSQEGDEGGETQEIWRADLGTAAAPGVLVAVQGQLSSPPALVGDEVWWADQVALWRAPLSDPTRATRVDGTDGASEVALVGEHVFATIPGENGSEVVEVTLEGQITPISSGHGISAGRAGRLLFLSTRNDVGGTRSSLFSWDPANRQLAALSNPDDADVLSPVSQAPDNGDVVMRARTAAGVQLLLMGGNGVLVPLPGVVGDSAAGDAAWVVRGATP